jgi:FKBP-type peptidyl-prolyl cis-trans isomerase
VLTLKQFWQRLMQRLRQSASGRDGERERELSVARVEKQRLQEQLTGLGAESARERQEHKDLRARLLDRQDGLEQALSAAQSELQAVRGDLAGLQDDLEREVSGARQEQERLREQLAALQADFERELGAANLEKQALRSQISGVQADLELLRSRDEQQRDELEQRFHRLQSEREAAQRQIEAMHVSLADAASRQEATDGRVNTLEARLQGQGQELQVALQEARMRDRKQARRLIAAMTLAVAAFVLGMAASAINFWEVRHTSGLLSEVREGISDIRSTLDGLPEGRAQIPAETAPVRRQTRAKPTMPTPAPASGEAPRADEAVEGLSEQRLPAPAFVASKSLPLNGHAFRSRRDAHAFFEENAGQPGVASLPSGLQYRVLLPGAGKSPGRDDKVTIEYRAFRPDGTELDNSFQQDLPTTFIVKEAIPGLRQALPQMREGAQWELYIPPALASKGVRRRGPHGFEPLILTVELLSVAAAESVDAQPEPRSSRAQ